MKTYSSGFAFFLKKKNQNAMSKNYFSFVVFTKSLFVILFLIL